MGLSDDAFFMIKHTPSPNGNHPISSPDCPMGVADMLELYRVCIRYKLSFYLILFDKKSGGGSVAAGTAGGGGLPTNTLIQTLALSLALVPLGLSAVAVFPPFAT